MADFEQTPSGLLVPTQFADKRISTRRPRPEMREIATTADGRDITRGYLDPLSIQPSSDSVLQLRGNGDYTIYKEVLRDDQVGPCFAQRRLAVIGKEWGVDPGGTKRQDKAAADFMRELLGGIGWDRITDRMLFGVYYGFAVAEAMWGRDGRHVTLDNIKVRDRRRFGFDGLGRLRMKTFSNAEGELMPDRKFWSFETGADHDDDPYGLGLAHWLYWPVFFKRNGLRFWLIFLEKFGQPTAKGTYPPNALPEEKNRLLQALSAIATDAGIIIPEGMKIELIEAARSGTADYSVVYDRMDRAIAKICLGQTASTEGTPGRLGSDDLQGDVRLDLIKADADLVCESFSRTIGRWLTEWNFPGAKTPVVYRKVEPDEDVAKRAETDSKIHSMGFRPTLRHIQDNYGGEWEQRQDATPTSLLPSPAFAVADDLSPAALMLEQARERTELATNAWINQVRDLVSSVDSLEELREQLLALYPTLSLDQYATAMAEASAAARLAGRNEVTEERPDALR